MSLIPQLVSERFSTTFAGMKERKGALFFATAIGLSSYPLLSRLNANRFVCLSLTLLPPLLTAEWSVRRFQKESVQKSADIIWTSPVPPSNLFFVKSSEVVKELRGRIGKETVTPAPVVYFLLHANGWSDLQKFQSVSSNSVSSEVVKLALELSDSDSEAIKKFKNSERPGRPADYIEVVAQELSDQRKVDFDLMKSACLLLANHRRWHNKFDTLL